MRVDAASLRDALARAEAVERELSAARQRYEQAKAERAAETERLHTQLVCARAELITRDTGLASLRQELDALRATVPDLAARHELTQRVAVLTERNGALARQLAERAWAADLSAAKQAAPPARPHSPPDSHEAAAPANVQQPAVHLAEKAVLCVGGRDRTIAVYRDVVERHGGRFAHHDGGQKDSPHQLDAVLAAADLVICQTGCVSHNAYWLVKDHCKRTGKACVFLDRSGRDSFARALVTAATAVDASSSVSPG